MLNHNVEAVLWLFGRVNKVHVKVFRKYRARRCASARHQLALRLEGSARCATPHMWRNTTHAYRQPSSITPNPGGSGNVGTGAAVQTCCLNTVLLQQALPQVYTRTYPAWCAAWGAPAPKSLQPTVATWSSHRKAAPRTVECICQVCCTQAGPSAPGGNRFRCNPRTKYWSKKEVQLGQTVHPKTIATSVTLVSLRYTSFEKSLCITKKAPSPNLPKEFPCRRPLLVGTSGRHFGAICQNESGRGINKRPWLEYSLWSSMPSHCTRLMVPP